MNEIRTKKSSLENIKILGFTPELVIDIGAAAGTVGLYDVWPESHIILVDILEKYEGEMKKICQNISSAEYYVASIGAINTKITYHMDPKEDHCLTFGNTYPSDWIKKEVNQLSLDQICYGSKLKNDFNKLLIKVDVDGGELDVIESGRQVLLEKECVVILETPLIDSEYSRLTSLLIKMQEIGYEIYDIIEPVFRPGDSALWQVDSIFVPRNSSLRTTLKYN
jgi:FkbM family methyltransferase